MINRAAQLQPDSGVYTKIDDGYSFKSYKTIAERGKLFASALQNIGIGVGDCIGTFMYNNGRHFMVHYAAACAGVLLNALNFRLFPADLAYIINHVHAKVIIVDAMLLSEFEKVSMDTIPHVHTMIVCGANEAVMS